MRWIPVDASGRVDVDFIDQLLSSAAERMALVSIATLVTAWFGAAPDTAEYSVHVIGLALLIVGIGFCCRRSFILDRL